MGICLHCSKLAKKSIPEKFWRKFVENIKNKTQILGYFALRAFRPKLGQQLLDFNLAYSFLNDFDSSLMLRLNKIDKISLHN